MPDSPCFPLGIANGGPQPTHYQEAMSTREMYSSSKIYPADGLKRILNVAAGLDVHNASISACVAKNIDGEPSHIVREFDTYKFSLRELAEWLVRNKVEAVSMESTGVYWRSPYDILQSYGLNTILVNAYMVKNVPGRKTDTADCRWLADLTMSGLLRKSRVPNRDDSELRALSRLRQSHVQVVASFKNRGYKLLADAGFNVSVVLSDLYGATGRLVMSGLMTQTPPEDIIEVIVKTMGYRLKAPRKDLLNALEGKMSPLLATELGDVLSAIDYHQGRIANLTSHLHKGLVDAGHGAELELLQTIPGVSLTGAMSLVVELGDLSDFRSPKACCSWAGMVPGNNESASKRKSCKTRHGNSYIRRILCEIASASVKTTCYFKERYMSLKVRRGHRKAIVAVGHKILKVAYCMLTRGEVYKDHTVDFDELRTKKNASRWIQQLIKLGLIDVNESGEIVAKANSKAPAKKAEAKSEAPAKKAEAKSEVPAKKAEVKSRVPAKKAEVKAEAPAKKAEVKSKVPAKKAEVKSKVPAKKAEVKSKVPAKKAKVSA